MPSAVTCPIIITGCSTRADGSLSIRCSTPELSVTEKVAIMELQNTNLRMLLQPLDGAPTDLKEVKSEFNPKSFSVRLRACLFVLHKQQERSEDFQTFYARYMTDLIESVKAQLEPEHQ